MCRAILPATTLLVTSVVAVVPSSREPIEWTDVVDSYARVRSYTALYDKEEKAISNGEPQRIRLSFRKPLDVRMEWLDDRDEVDQIAVYRQGFNDGKLLARRRGLLGSMLGTLRLDPHDRRALEDSRHPVTEVGIGAIIDRATNALAEGHATIRGPVDDTLDGQPAHRFEFDATSNSVLFGVPGARRAHVWVDRDLRLPVRVELFDEKGNVLERHRFRHLRLNPDLSDQVFTL